VPRRTTRTAVNVTPTVGSVSRTGCSAAKAASAPPAVVIVPTKRLAASQLVAAMRCGQHEVPEAEGQDGDEDEHPGRDDAAHPRLELGDLRLGVSERDGRAHHRADAAEQVRNADQVAQHVVAVQPQERRQLLEHLDLRQKAQQYQRFVPRRCMDGGGGDDDDRVDVDAAEVRAQPSSSVQLVGVGDVV
jgi:hypothetical protein